jgi:RNA polymerase sigma-70 factor (ECF subfamily)
MTTIVDRGAGPAVRSGPPGRRSGDVDLARDAELVARAQAGDPAAFAELYETYHDRLLRVCARRLRDRDLAEEVVQEAFARAWRALPSFGGERRFYPWLSVIAAHLCIDEETRRRRVAPVAELAVSRLVSDEDTGEDRVVAASDREVVADALRRLSGRHRRLLLAREELGWSYQEIAAAEGVPVSTVETALFRARRTLRKLVLAAQDGTRASALAVLGGLLGLRRRLFGAQQALTSSLSSAPAVSGLAKGTVALAVLGAGVAAGTLLGPASPTPARPRVQAAAPVPPRSSAGVASARAVGNQPVPTPAAPQGTPVAAHAGAPSGGASAPSGGAGSSSVGLLPGLFGPGAALLARSAPTSGAPTTSSPTPTGAASSTVLGALAGTLGAAHTAATGLTGGVVHALGDLLSGGSQDPSGAPQPATASSVPSTSLGAVLGGS